jgi:hypothetical protein
MRATIGCDCPTCPHEAAFLATLEPGDWPAQVPPRLLPAGDANEEKGPEDASTESAAPAAIVEAPVPSVPVPVPEPAPDPPVHRGGFRHEHDDYIQLPSGAWWRR